MEEKNLFWILPLVFVITSVIWFYIFVFAESHANIKDIQIKTEMSNYWACMDGCSNMQEIIEGKLSYYNETSKFKHDVCAGVCCRQYMTTLGCEI